MLMRVSVSCPGLFEPIKSQISERRHVALDCTARKSVSLLHIRNCRQNSPISQMAEMLTTKTIFALSECQKQKMCVVNFRSYAGKMI